MGENVPVQGSHKGARELRGGKGARNFSPVEKEAHCLWVVFAFSGPVLWAISVHLDKYLVDRFFKDSNVAVLLVFTAWVGLLLLPFIWLFEPDATAPGAASIALIMLSGILYMGAMLFYLRALQAEEASVVAPFFQIS